MLQIDPTNMKTIGGIFSVEFKYADISQMVVLTVNVRSSNSISNVTN
jgi:hypothetical protein